MPSNNQCKWIKCFAIFLGILNLGCNNSSAPSSPEKIEIAGNVARGLAVVNTPITIKDQTGNTIVSEDCQTNDKGQFRCSIKTAVATERMYLTASNMTALIVKKPTQNLTQNINPITDYIADKANNGAISATENDPLTVTADAYENEVVDVSERLGVKSEKFINEPFQPKLANNLASGSTVDDVLEALKSDNATLDKTVIEKELKDAQKDNPIITKPPIQVRMAVAAIERGTSPATAKSELQGMLSTTVPKANTLVTNFGEVATQFDKTKQAADEKFSTDENKEILIRLILKVVESALIKASEDTSIEGLKQLTENIMELLQKPLITKVNNESQKFDNPTEIVTLQDTLKKEVSKTKVNKGNVNTLLNDGVQQAEAKIAKWFQLTPSDVEKTNDLTGWNYGDAVAIAGSNAIVGHGEKESAYIFSFNGTEWTQQQKLEPGGVWTGFPTNFGSSVAIAGSTAIVGQPDGGEDNKGAVYIYFHNGTQWALQQKLDNNFSGLADIGDFGRSVAIDGNTLIVGAPTARNTGSSGRTGSTSNAGNAYVFERNGTTWTLKYNGPLINHINDAAKYNGSSFGKSVAIGRNGVAVVGAPLYKTNSGLIQFMEMESGRSQSTNRGDHKGASDNFLGNSVATDGTTAVASSMKSGGELIIFKRTNEFWGLKDNEIKTIPIPRSSNNYPRGTYLGPSVAVKGDTLIASNFSTVYIFKRDSNGNWKQEETFAERSGRSVAISDQFFMMGGNEEVWVYRR